MATNEEEYKKLLDAAKKLSEEDRRQFIDQLLKEPKVPSSGPSESIVERTSGTIKNLDRETIRHLAESDEFCGY